MKTVRLKSKERAFRKNILKLSIQTEKTEEIQDTGEPKTVRNPCGIQIWVLNTACGMQIFLRLTPTYCRHASFFTPSFILCTESYVYAAFITFPFIPLHRGSRGQQAQQVQLRVPDVQPGAEVPALPGVPRKEPRRGAPASLHHLRQAVRHTDQAAHARQHPLRPEALPGQAQHNSI
jgi:hypothetical protein